MENPPVPIDKDQYKAFDEDRKLQKASTRVLTTVTGHIRPKLRVSIGRWQGVCSHQRDTKGSKTRTKGTETGYMIGRTVVYTADVREYKRAIGRTCPATVQYAVCLAGQPGPPYENGCNMVFCMLGTVKVQCVANLSKPSLLARRRDV